MMTILALVASLIPAALALAIVWIVVSDQNAEKKNAEMCSQTYSPIQSINRADEPATELLQAHDLERECDEVNVADALLPDALERWVDDARIESISAEMNDLMEKLSIVSYKNIEQHFCGSSMSDNPLSSRKQKVWINFNMERGSSIKGFKDVFGVESEKLLIAGAPALASGNHSYRGSGSKRIASLIRSSYSH